MDLRNMGVTAGVVFLLAGCQGSTGGGDSSGPVVQTQQSSEVSVMTSFYPLYEIAREVGGENLVVRNLVPAGAEPHDYEPSPKDIAALQSTDLLVVNGLQLEPWLEKLAPELQRSGVRVLNQSAQVRGIVANDPHIWLDPVLYSQEAEFFQKAVADIDPSNAEKYLQRAKIFQDKLSQLDQDFRNGLRDCAMKDFVTNHAAFGYLAKRYGLNMISVAGFSPESEPSPKVLVDLTDLLRKKQIKYVLVETLVSSKVGETLANEVGAQTLVVNPLEGLTDGEIAEGKNYFSVMRENLRNLQIAMNCR